MLSEREAIVLSGMASSARAAYPLRLDEVVKRARAKAEARKAAIGGGEGPERPTSWRPRTWSSSCQ